MSAITTKQGRLERDKDQLFKMRHTAEHVLQQALKNLYPQVQLAMGPATEEGFYVDFDASAGGRTGEQNELKISEANFAEIEKEMRLIIEADLPMTRETLSLEVARQIFADNPYKLEWLAEIESKDEEVTVFWTGEPGEKGAVVDLCAGPHAVSTGRVKAFKLLSVAGAYWHGDEKNKMLSRIYGTAFFSQAELDEYLYLQAEAKKRDHKKLGKSLDLFLFSAQVGGGLPIFTAKGLALRQAIENFVVEEKKKRGYQFVWTPHIAKSQIYMTSGHWQKYDAMFNSMKLDDDEYVLKPMNCPHHFQIYLNKPRSYRDLPLRIAENGTVYRYEKSGEVNGLLRVRSLTVDDTHTFLRPDQIEAEIDQVLNLIETVFKTFGFNDYYARISLHDSRHFEKYLGSQATWQKAEQALIKAVKDRGLSYELGEGEAAFYGPKIDVMVRDSLGREWQLSTCQLDFNQPENFQMSYINEKGEKIRPAILHIAVLGSLERFMAILIEHYGGEFPAWLAPVQVMVLPIADRHHNYAQLVSRQLSAENLRVEVDIRAESLPAKIRDAELKKVPYVLVVGDREADAELVAVRRRHAPAGKAAQPAVLPVTEFITELKLQIANKS